MVEHELTKILSQCEEKNRRALLVLAGSSSWCQHMAYRCLRFADVEGEVVWVGERSVAPYTDRARFAVRSVAADSAQQLLGSDIATLVLNARSGFSPDVLGQVAGTLCGGGLLVLLTPAFDTWPSYDDPDYRRYRAVRPGPYSMNGHFIRRFIKMLECESQLDKQAFLRVFQQCDIDADTSQFNTDGIAHRQTIERSASAANGWQPTAEQQKVIDALQALMASPRGAISITADRGRGKSVALGLAVDSLLPRADDHIVVTAPLRSHVDNLFQVFDQSTQGRRLKYIAVDQLIIAALSTANPMPPIDLLVVDEAAAIPLSVLEKMIACSERVVFASTVHGYEGSGRGFSLRFQQRLKREFQDCWFLSLSQPVRWSADDPLERFINRVLLLGAEPSLATISNAAADSLQHPGAFSIRKLSNEDLLQDESLLAAVFGLLIDAHYQTRPSDLRYLLDTPYTHLWVAFCGCEQEAYQQTDYQQARHGEESHSETISAVLNGAVSGVLLVCEEGGFIDADNGESDGELRHLANSIANGQRRPQGNMLAQLLANQTGDARWCMFSSLRVMRIAVEANARRAGIATRLLAQMEAWAVDAAYQYWGSSFGFSPSLIDFWQAVDALPVHLGLRLDKASGARNLAVVKPLADAASAMVASCQRQLASDARLWRDRYLRELADGEWRCLWSFFTRLGEESAFTETASTHALDCAAIRRFIAREIPFDRIYPALYRWCGTQSPDDSGLTATFASVKRMPNWQLLATELGLSGRKQVVEAVRTELGRAFVDNAEGE